MKLSDYLALERISLGEFARRIDVRNARTVQRYIKGQRLPSRAIMERITRETAGKVSPNDFFALSEADPIAKAELISSVTA
jgi:hypothetical protein